MQKVQFGTYGKKEAAITRYDTKQECFIPANGLTWGVVKMVFGANCVVMEPTDYSGMLRCIVKSGRGREVGEVILF